MRRGKRLYVRLPGIALGYAGNCSCNYVPHLFEHVDMGDVGALIAPRPLLVETGTHDDLNGPVAWKTSALR